MMNWNEIVQSLDIDEKHQDLFNKYVNNLDITKTNEIVISLRIFSILLKSDKNIKICTSKFKNYKTFGINIVFDIPHVDMYSNLIEKEIIKYIEENNNKIIYVYNFLEKIETKDNYITFYSNFDFNNREEKLKRILK